MRLLSFWAFPQAVPLPTQSSHTHHQAQKLPSQLDVWGFGFHVGYNGGHAHLYPVDKIGHQGQHPDGTHAKPKNQHEFVAFAKGSHAAGGGYIEVQSGPGQGIGVVVLDDGEKDEEDCEDEVEDFHVVVDFWGSYGEK